jgi:hypothetical protein
LVYSFDISIKVKDEILEKEIQLGKGIWASEIFNWVNGKGI